MPFGGKDNGVQFNRRKDPDNQTKGETKNIQTIRETLANNPTEEKALTDNQRSTDMTDTGKQEEKDRDPQIFIEY